MENFCVFEIAYTCLAENHNLWSLRRDFLPTHGRITHGARRVRGSSSGHCALWSRVKRSTSTAGSFGWSAVSVGLFCWEARRCGNGVAILEESWRYYIIQVPIPTQLELFAVSNDFRDAGWSSRPCQWGWLGRRTWVVEVRRMIGSMPTGYTLNWKDVEKGIALNYRM